MFSNAFIRDVPSPCGVKAIPSVLHAPAFPARPFRRSRAETPCEWLIEPLRSRPEFSVRRTFGCWSFYLGEKNVLLYVPAGDEDGEGILIPTSPEFHASLIAEFPGLAPHDFLKKWLCLGANADDYEETAAAIVRLILRGDPRVGVPGSIRSRRRKKRRSRG